MGYQQKDVEFSHHEPCQACGSKDNLGVWKDGHKWCFGCGFYFPAESSLAIEEIQHSLQNDKKRRGSGRRNYIDLPFDFSSAIPAQALNWLNQYGLTKGEIRGNNLGWSQSVKRLIFPIYDSYGNLLLWQGRDFSGEPKRQKYYNEGYPEKVLHPIGNDVDTVVLCEDMVSAIKIGRVSTGMCLFGSELSYPRIHKLKGRFNKLFIWLDNDKARRAVTFSERARPWFESVQVIVTPKDPKEYSTEEIEEYVRNR